MRVDLIPWLLARSVRVPCPRPDLGECWEWTGALSGKNSRSDGGRPITRWRGVVVLVARLVLHWQLDRPLKKGRLAGHRCDNAQCVRPDHLEETTYTRNLIDAWARGRRAPKSFAAA